MNVEPWSELVKLSEVMTLHAEGLRRFGGESTERASDPECVEGRLGAAWNAEAYCEPNDNQQAGLIFAGYLLFYLVKAHCFVDGNKRVSWTACMRVLAGLGLTVNATPDEAENMIIGLLEPSGGKGGEDVVIWLADRIQPAP